MEGVEGQMAGANRSPLKHDDDADDDDDDSKCEDDEAARVSSL